MSEGARNPQAALLRSAALELKSLQSKLDALERAKAEPIAIIGLGCRFPGGATDPEAFWRVLRDGVDAIREVPRGRWDVDAYYDPDPRAPGKMSTRLGGFLECVDEFDPYFFGISPRECAAMDPQQRLFLEVAWEALEDAGQAIDRLRGTLTGVFVGVFGNDYATLQQADPERIDVYGSSSSGCGIPGRLSFLLDLRGPCVAVDTACSSSLTAVHLACQSLRSGESKLAVAGGVSLILSPISTISLTKIQALAPDGRCKAFDARADGMGRGEGCGAVILKRLSDAIADGDPIRAVIRGSAINQDGASTSFTSPNVLAQQAVIRRALESAGVEPTQVDYVEAHGTGTALGDPIEIEALKATYGRPRPDGRPCVVGALKTNMGHLEGAAGIAGLMKVVQSLEHEAIPSNLHFTKLNPHISLDHTPFVLPTDLRPWPKGARRRLGAVSAFGLNGANAHVVLEEAPEAPAAGAVEPHAPGERAFLLPISAKSPEALRALATAYEARLGAEPPTPLHDLCYTASVRRAHHEHRLAVQGSTREALRERLSAFLRGDPAQGVASGATAAGKRRGLVFTFSPHGSQWSGMGRRLLDEEPVFRATIERCDQLMRAHVGWSLIDRLRGDDQGWLEQIDVLQPTLFALQVALAALVRSWGIEPDAVVGHSMGEVAAAHVAGALRLEDAVRISCRRSALLRKTSGQGAMAVVELSLDAARAELVGYESRLFIAVSNSPRSTVISGDPEALEELLDRLESRGIFCGWGVADVASHSPQMEALSAELVKELEGITPEDTSVPFYSGVSGAPVPGKELGPGYWVKNLKQTVLFSAAVQRILQDGIDIFLELCPHPILAPAIDDWLRHLDRQGSVLATMRRDEAPRATLLGALASLYTLGHSIDWARQYPSGGRCVRLPSYLWQRGRYWLEEPSTSASRGPARRPLRGGAAAEHPLLGERWRAPLPEGTRYWEIPIDLASFPYLADHCIQGSVVLPAVTYLEVTTIAARELFGTSDVTLEGVRFEKMLIVPEQDAISLQLVITPESADAAEFRIFSLAPGRDAQGDSWTPHARGIVRRAPEATPARAAPEAIRNRCPETMAGAEFYELAEERGIQFGPSFRGVTQLFRSDEEAIARVQAPGPVAAEVPAYQAHPAVLDACFHVIGAAALKAGKSRGEDAIYLPTGLSSFRLHGPLNASLWSHTVLRRSPGEGSQRSFEGDLAICDDEGRVAIEARGVRFQHFDGGRAEMLDDLLYAVSWRPKALTAPAPEAPSAASPGSFLVFTDAKGVGKALRSSLEARRERCIVATYGDGYRALDAGLYQLDPTRPDDFRRLFGEAFGGDAPPCRGVIFLWALDAEGPESLSLASLQAAEDRFYVGLMHLVQAMIQAGFRDMPRLWLVTQGAQAVGEHPVAIAQAPLWSLGRTITHEHPELGCIRVDLDHAVASGEGAQALLAQIERQDGEDQIAIRSGRRYVARLERWSPGAARAEGRDAPLRTRIGERPFRLEAPARPEGFILRSTARRAPSPGEVEIQVRAAAIRPGDAVPIAIEGAAAPRGLGASCAGTIVAVGEGVAGLRPGEEVIALAPDGIGSHVITSSRHVAPKPAHVTMAEAATIPAALLEAHHALYHVGRLERGERVLIHGAAGGVGLAAAQLAQRSGAEVFAASRSPEELDLLHALGVAHVIDERASDLAGEVMARTRGQGVDLVIGESGGGAERVALLREDGRLVEVGPRTRASRHAPSLASLEKSFSLSAVDIARTIRERPAAAAAQLEQIAARVAARELMPVAHRAYPLADLGGALRGEAPGAIVASFDEGAEIAVAPAAGTGAALRPDATYLITGGLSGLGLKIAAWMAEAGARHLVLVGRRGTTPEAESTLAQMVEAGVQVAVERVDVSQEAQLRGLLEKVERSMPPLHGIVHSAVTLDDGILLRQTRERFRSAVAAKLEGAFLLHRLTAARPLDFFVLFSSISSLLGGPGDGSYGASNAFVDALAHHRRAMGLPGLSINWGSWSEVGLGAAQANRGQRIVSRGVAGMSPEEGVALFARLLGQPAAQIGAMRFDLRQFRQFYPKVAGSPMFSELGRSERATRHAAAKVADLLSALRAAEPVARRSRLEALVREQIIEVLRLDPSRLTADTPLNTLGFDSLMAVELRNRLEHLFGATLSVTLVWGYPTIAALVPHLASKIGIPLEQPEEAPKAEEDRKDDSALSSLLGEIEQLSADTALSLLVGKGRKDKR